MENYRLSKRLTTKERDTGPRGGDKQPAHEGGREGTGTRPSGSGSSGQKSGGQSGGQSGGKSSGGQQGGKTK